MHMLLLSSNKCDLQYLSSNKCDLLDDASLVVQCHLIYVVNGMIWYLNEWVHKIQIESFSGEKNEEVKAAIMKIVEESGKPKGSPLALYCTTLLALLCSALC